MEIAVDETVVDVVVIAADATVADVVVIADLEETLTGIIWELE